MFYRQGCLLSTRSPIPSRPQGACGSVNVVVCGNLSIAFPLFSPLHLYRSSAHTHLDKEVNVTLELVWVLGRHPPRFTHNSSHLQCLSCQILSGSLSFSGSVELPVAALGWVCGGHSSEMSYYGQARPPTSPTLSVHWATCDNCADPARRDQSS